MANFLTTRKGIILIGALTAVAVVVAVIVVFVTKKPNDDGSSPIVTIDTGSLQGLWVDGAQGRGFKFAAFYGVPYAAPPIGDLRFKGPRPADKWGGVRNAAEEGSMCYQGGLGDNSTHGKGSEDCLYLNVYTPILPPKNNSKLPVYFFIHGGAFNYGSSSGYGPDFLLQHDIVIVTMNYRLGAFGFLNLDTEDVPGNAGMKDLVAALRWVRRNIREFGGDPDRITVGGQSAGASCASWLAILPETKGLIKGAALQSGSAIQTWAFNRNPLEIARETAKVLAGKTVNDTSEMALLMKNASDSALLEAGLAAIETLSKRTILGNERQFFFAPTLESREQGNETILIKRDAESYMINLESDDIPHLLGVASEEGAGYFPYLEYANDEVKLEEEIEHLRVIMPITMVPDQQTKQLLGLEYTIDETEISKTEQQFIDHFFSNESATEKCPRACLMAKFMDVAFTADVTHFALVRAKYSKKPTYAYVFALKSDYNTMLEPNTPDFLKNAVTHDDDLYYLWFLPGVNQSYHGTGVASRGLRRMVTMWANFIKFGNPTPNDNMWKPIENGDAETYLEITDNPTQRYLSMLKSDAPIWTSTFSQYRRNKSP